MTEKMLGNNIIYSHINLDKKKVTSAESKQNINVEGKTTVCLKNL